MVIAKKNRFTDDELNIEGMLGLTLLLTPKFISASLLHRHRSEDILFVHTTEVCK